MNPETEEKIYFYTEDLQVGYGGKQILNPVRIGIKKGEILTLVGPNGAGKSTILKSVAAQLPPLGGAVYLDGADLLGMKGTERARRMAVMFTEKVHAEWMTCRDVVAAGRYPYTGRFGVLSEEDWKAVDEAMEAVQVSELRERDFQTLSDGQRQRVMLARALCQEPELLLLDEPTSYLDIRYKLEFMSVSQELAQIIEEKKNDSFRLTYTSGNDLYIAAGYGKQETGGYSITVPELYLTDNSIIVKTELKGPERSEPTGEEPSYPYIVLRTELLEEPVVFQ